MIKQASSRDKKTIVLITDFGERDYFVGLMKGVILNINPDVNIVDLTHCIPVDPFYLSWKAKEFDFRTHFIELAGEINTNMPNYVVSKIIDALNEKEKCLKNSKILILGIAYKKDTDDIRESPGVEIIDILKNKGANVDYHDPYISNFSGMRKYPHLSMKSIELSEKKLKDYDCVVIITDHSCYNYKWIVENSKLIIDTRNATSKIKSEKIKKA
ncbi:SAM-dependent chlorinase/fluorinase [Candidatus Aminicenantes bacterium AC-334-E05]|nr:SAM-dependent chlorinase/fluorinase [Candidatus Aminicenantes bacterium AC-334-E05]